ncbi:uncharacterized protein FTJAE_626 [Fusarium tjaetaba]|uniref:Uncharacterized protein n=1 Tax=Fusarium tjaetaba TaxID=1567544 RepID=A0A8H5SEA3_9HYPO|nr:uncharacterized protein FTJAE_626 [Fusarium tjaetaba]KAF5650202.1 hypothetical protein FTJAE_626 [Fusarium tjaetaba]
MDATELSDDRVAEIQKAVGNPSTSKPFLSSTLPELHLADHFTSVSPDEYSAKLRHVTGSDEILLQFLEKACKVDREMAPYPAEEWLKRLSAMDFGDVAAISKHHFALTLYRVRRFDLGTDGESTFAVETDPEALLTQKATLPPLSPSADIESGDYNAHPSLISLQKGEDPEPSKTGPVTASSQPLPSLVMPIGQLQKKSKEEDDDAYVDTDYFLAIDATKTNHPVWLIYDRNPRDYFGDRELVDPDKRRLVFKELGKNFDAMMVLPSLQWWIMYYGRLDFAHMLKIMRATGITGPIQAKGLALSEAKKILSK